METSFSKHVYQIHVNNCAQAVLKKFKEAPQANNNIKISPEEFEERLNIAVSIYKESVDLTDQCSDLENYQKALISTQHPAFDYWFALFISTKETYEIPLILDAYNDGKFGHIENFIGHLQYLIPNCLKSHVSYFYEEHIREIVNWVRDHQKKLRAESNNQSNLKIGELNVHLSQTNIQNNNSTVINHKSFSDNSNPERVSIEPTEVEVELKQKPRREKNKETNRSLQSYDLIQTDLTYEEVFIYFRQLCDTKNRKGRSYMSEEDVKYLVESNFYFKNRNPVTPRKHFKIELKKGLLRRFFYEFYYHIDQKKYTGKKDEYSLLLINNFIKFKTDTIENNSSNFSRHGASKYPFRKLD
jgi:hypothetical protein